VLNVVVGIVVSAISEITASEPKNNEALDEAACSKNLEIKSELAKLKVQIENLEKIL
jgi:hypothetical protein